MQGYRTSGFVRHHSQLEKPYVSSSSIADKPQDTCTRSSGPTSDRESQCTWLETILSPLELFDSDFNCNCLESGVLSYFWEFISNWFVVLAAARPCVCPKLRTKGHLNLNSSKPLQKGIGWVSKIPCQRCSASVCANTAGRNGKLACLGRLRFLWYSVKVRTEDSWKVCSTSAERSSTNN